jgi:hypothetical protein
MIHWMVPKRKFLSRNRMFVSVWNEGKKKDSLNGPWMVCRNGENVTTAMVKELKKPFADRPDIRIGIVQAN